jgi:aldose sugar dehydrogenase
MPPQVLRHSVEGVTVEAIASGLELPWSLAFAPDGRLFVTERPGRIQVLRRGEPPKLYLNLEEVTHHGEGGLMGMTLHPRFPNPPHLYVMYTFLREGKAFNRVVRLIDAGDTARLDRVILDNLPAAQYHNGGILAFGPDGYLYIGTGDAVQPPLSQDRSSLAGKILRVDADGGIPEDNPFPNSPVYAYGFRNVTGLAWHPQTRDLWAATHGPSGEFPDLHHRDAVYIVKKGGNHGWPVVVGTTELPGIESPILYYPEAAVPPGAAIFYSGRMFPDLRGNFLMTALRAEHLQRVEAADGKQVTKIERWWPSGYGRLRALVEGPDGAVYFTTSNRDGRASRDFPNSDHVYRASRTR